MGKTAGGRLAWADLLRMAALLACLMVWLAEEGLAGSALGSASWQAYQLYNSLLRWCVPVFAMLSGMFLLEPRTGLTLPRLLLGRVLRVLIAIVLWGAVYRLADGLLSGGRFGWGLVFSSLSAALRADTHEWLWFLYVILGLYLVTPVLRAFVRGAGRGDFHVFFLLVFVLAFLLPTLLELWPNGAAGRWLNRLDIHLVLGFAGYYVLGYYLKAYTLSRPAEYLVYLLGALGAAVTVGGTWALSLRRGETVTALCGFTSPSVALTALAVCVLFRYVLGVSDERSRRQRMSGAARAALGAYLFAGLLRLLLNHFGVTAFSLPAALSPLAWGLGLLLVSLAAAWLVSKIPLLGPYLM